MSSNCNGSMEPNRNYCAGDRDGNNRDRTPPPGELTPESCSLEWDNEYQGYFCLFCEEYYDYDG